MVGGALRTEVTRAEVETTLIDGFFPATAADERPQAPRRLGLQELGLAYASDAAVTRHLAAFLARHHDVAPAGPSAILFNGGVMKAGALRHRLIDVLQSWRADGEPLRVLEGAHLDLAVARGRRLLRLARRGRGVRIRGGTARAYYVGIESSAPAVPGCRPPMKALCVAPFGMEEGNEVELPGAEFGLVVGRAGGVPVLRLLVRRDDRPGVIVDGWDAGELEELAPLEATLDAEGEEGRAVPVRLRAHVTEVGTLELWCVARAGERRWKVEFNVRQSS